MNQLGHSGPSIGAADFDLFADVVLVAPSPTCGRCTHYAAKVFGDHGKCPFKGRGSMLKAFHECTTGRFALVEQGGVHAGA